MAKNRSLIAIDSFLYLPDHSDPEDQVQEVENYAGCCIFHRDLRSQCYKFTTNEKLFVQRIRPQVLVMAEVAVPASVVQRAFWTILQ